MGKRGKRGDKLAAKKAILKRLDALAKQVEEELKGADLFTSLPPTDDCAICLVPLPRGDGKVIYQGCCGKRICSGCNEENAAVIEKMNSRNGGDNSDRKPISLTCPFCREPEPTGTDVRQLEARASKGDGHACNLLGLAFEEDHYASPKDEMKALHCYILAAEFGSAEACSNIGMALNEGKGVTVDKGTARLFHRVAALRGGIISRHLIGSLEYDDLGNHELAIRHWKIAAAAGMQPSIKRLRDIYNADGKKPGKEFISKDELDSIYRAGHDAQMEVKTEEREKHFEGEDLCKC